MGQTCAADLLRMFTPGTAPHAAKYLNQYFNVVLRFFFIFRNYKRKNTQLKPLTDTMLIQVRQLKETGMSIREIARNIGYAESTIRMRLKIGCGVESLGRFKSVFTPAQEKEIVEHCIALDSRFYGLTLKSLRFLAFQFAEQNGIPHSFSQVSKLAGHDWTRDFLKRNNLSLRMPRKTSVARTMGFNREQLAQYFKNLQEALDTHKFPAHRIYNMDESGFQTVPNKLPKHIAPVGKREVAKNVSAEQGKTVTVACSMSAAGNYVPPFFIFARKRHNPLLLKDGPAGSAMAVTDSGYMNTPTFVVYLEHFIKHTNPSAHSPILLLLDNHVSHVSLQAITFAKNNNIHMLSLPPHSSHRTQPLDRNFFRPLKAYYDDLCDNWTTSNPGQVVTEYHVAGIFSKAYERTATVGKATEGFRVTGICPLDINIFTDEDFLPATVTDQDQDVDTADIDERRVDCLDEVPPIGQLPVGNPASRILHPARENNERNMHMLASGSPEPGPSSGSLDALISPSQILPLPKINIRRKRTGRGLKSALLTSTPNKLRLQELDAEKKQKNELQKNRPTNKKVRTKLFLPEDSSDSSGSCDYDHDSSGSENEKTTELQRDSYVVVRVNGKSKGAFRLYVARIVGLQDDGYIGVFYKKVPMTPRFILTDEEAFFTNTDIIKILQKPVLSSITRYSGMIRFTTDLSMFSLY